MEMLILLAPNMNSIKIVLKIIRNSNNNNNDFLVINIITII